MEYYGIDNAHVRSYWNGEMFPHEVDTKIEDGYIDVLMHPIGKAPTVDDYAGEGEFVVKHDISERIYAQHRVALIGLDEVPYENKFFSARVIARFKIIQ